MPISAEYAGWIYPPAPAYRASRAEITEFARATQDENPTYFGDHPTALPTSVAVIATQAWGSFFGDEELGLALHRTARTDQTFDFYRPLREGDDVVARLTIERVRNRGNLDMVTTLVVLTVDGEVVCDTRPTLTHIREEAPHD